MSDHLWVVIPAAGKSKRFQDAGYMTPKPLLKVKLGGKTQTMLEHVVDSIPPYMKDIVIAVPAGVDHPLNTAYKVIEETVGQADTILQALSDLPAQDRVLILDCDMILHTEDLERMVRLLEVYDATIAVTRTFDPNASRVDTIPFPTKFAEKEPISEWGIVGARAFKSIGDLVTALNYTMVYCDHTGVEPYLSMAINSYPGSKYALEIMDFYDLGTPERLRESGAQICES